MTYTKGPWKHEIVNQYNDCQVIAPSENYKDNHIIAILAGKEAEANARLIAAAPELLEACRKIVASYGGENDPIDYNVLDDAYFSTIAAIAKAEGKE